MANLIKKPTEEFMKKARAFLRISINDEVINTEIETLISSCKQDLIRNGITSKMANSEEDGLIVAAVLLYLKAEFGLDNKNYEKYRNSYEILRTELALTDNYISEADNNVE